MRGFSESRRDRALAAGQSRILEMIAGGAPLAEALRAIVELIESDSPEMLASIVLLDDDGVHLRHGSAARLPAAYCLEIDGLPIGPSAGSCGTAMYRRETVICEDIATDPLWQQYRSLAAAHGLRASWSTPILDPQQRVLGSFALYFRKPMRPRERHRRLVEKATHVAAIALLRKSTESEQRFRGLAESSPDAILIHQDFRIVFVNRAMLSLMRAGEAAELIGRPSSFMLLPEFVEPARRRSEGLYAGEPQPRVEQVYLRLDGTPVDVEIAAAPILLEGRPAAQVTVRDITARKRAEEALRDSEGRFRGILEGMTVGFVSLDREWRLTYVNPQATQILGRSAQSLLGKRYLEAFPEAEGSPFELAYRRVMAERITLQHADFFPPWGRWFEQRVDPTPEGLSIFFQDVTERKQNESRIEYLATHDGLTNLPNRNLIHDRIGQAIAHARRTGRQLAVMYVDLDRFKVINDGFGHPFGDAVLRAAAERLAAVVREGDTVARQSGDEFLILLADLRRSTDAYIVAQKMLEAFSHPLLVQGREIHLTCSIGVSLCPEDGQSADALIGNADVAMYRAKDTGRNACQFFTREMSEATQRRVEIETELRSAIARGQLHLAYQPKVGLATGRISGCEALLRWTHPQLGSVSPARFIPVAEESGLILPIGDWVLRTACAQNKAWQSAGVPPLAVSVNLSARQFLQPDVVAWVMSVLGETGLAPECLELELTESLIAQDVDKAIANLMRLKEAGVRLSIDDFGSGYSSLSHLRRFRVDTLKIDQSFIRNMDRDVDDATIALAVIALAHNLRMTAVAEGVETETQLRLLRLNRCDEIQGYYFSKPVPGAEIEAMLRGGKRLPNPASA
jgi:diguanylate cyclase (GGDEF)-like protein/PAS domain S-box-containing protein